jgi:hypothetical protein
VNSKSKNIKERTLSQEAINILIQHLQSCTSANWTALARLRNFALLDVVHDPAMCLVVGAKLSVEAAQVLVAFLVDVVIGAGQYFQLGPLNTSGYG